MKRFDADRNAGKAVAAMASAAVRSRNKFREDWSLQ
jgi:hypothetical protein